MAHMYNSEFIHVHCILFYKAEFNFAWQQVFRHIFFQDPNRLHYEPWELQVFERIECQWPMFFALFVLDGLFNGREEQVCLKG